MHSSSTPAGPNGPGSTAAGLTRRGLLAALASVPLDCTLGGCDGSPSSAASSTSSTSVLTESGATTSAPPSSASAPAATTLRPPVPDAAFTALEDRFAAYLGVAVIDAGGRTVTAYRGDRRFAFCSTIKALSVGMLLSRLELKNLARVVRYTKADLVPGSPVTRKHVRTGMSLSDIATAALRQSDNTAGNLIVRELGGPAQLQAALRALGDDVTRVDRTEPALNQARPGDLRDTTTPLALATSFQALTVGDALPAGNRALLNWWLEGNTAGGSLISSVVSQTWRVGDRSGAGRYGTRNDVAVLRPPTGGSYVLAVMSSKDDEAARYDDLLVAEAARLILPVLTR